MVQPSIDLMVSQAQLDSLTGACAGSSRGVEMRIAEMFRGVEMRITDVEVRHSMTEQTPQDSFNVKNADPMVQVHVMFGALRSELTDQMFTDIAKTITLCFTDAISIAIHAYYEVIKSRLNMFALQDPAEQDRREMYIPDSISDGAIDSFPRNLSDQVYAFDAEDEHIPDMAGDRNITYCMAAMHSAPDIGGNDDRFVPRVFQDRGRVRTIAADSTLYRSAPSTTSLVMRSDMSAAVSYDVEYFF